MKTLNNYSILSNNNKSNKAFTLVELIIVITILAILATIWFISFQNYTKDARDGNRLTTLKNIETGLNLYTIKTGEYPLPDEKINISISGSLISYQWVIWDIVTNSIQMSKIPTDPKDGGKYLYTTWNGWKWYKLWIYSENHDDNSRYLNAIWIWPAMLLDENNQIVNQDIDVFLSQSWTSYKAVVDSNTTLSWNWIDLWGWLQALALKWWIFWAPLSCPDWFIPVAGQPEFSQPWFCVAKYEMTYVDADIPNSTDSGTDWNTVKYEIWKIPVSMPWKYPIADITQEQAIQACKSIWGHLITNNEWMTLARNIESNPINWSWEQVGSWYISNGLSNNATLWCGAWSDTKWLYSALPRSWGSKTGGWFWNAWCDEKRQLSLSNGEKIWDFSGNIWEHVNKTNTIDGVWFNIWKLKIDDNRVNWTIVDSWTSSEYYNWHNTWWNAPGITSFEREKYGPSNASYTHITNGIWNIRGYYTNDAIWQHNIFLRWGSAYNDVNAGIFTISLAWDDSDLTKTTVWVRCAF